ASRTACSWARWSSWLPWEKLSRAASIPARASCTTPLSAEAGPSVQTIFVRRCCRMVGLGPRRCQAPVRLKRESVAVAIVVTSLRWLSSVEASARRLMVAPGAFPSLVPSPGGTGGRGDKRDADQCGIGGARDSEEPSRAEHRRRDGDHERERDVE